VTAKNKNELTAANPTDERICSFGLFFNFLNSVAPSPITANDPHVNTKIDVLPIIKSEITMVVIGTIKAARQPIVTAANTLTAVTSSRFGAI